VAYNKGIRKKYTCFISLFFLKKNSMFYFKLYIVILVYLLDFFWYFSVPEDL
jgi:hypothetical protein